MKIQKNVFLSKHVTFKIGGLARYFFIAKNKKDIINAIKFSQEKKLSYFILGGGSNLLASDNGYDGIVIKISNSKISFNNKIIKVDAGVKLMDLVDFSIKNNLSGLEWAIGIPGTVGGAVRGNAGAFGHSISEVIEKVIVLRNNKDKKCNDKDCEFSYRDSVFKHNSDIIISAELQLQRGYKKQSQKLIQDYLKQRKQKHPLEYASAGCVFKNPKPLSTAQLIEDCGLKGKQIGGAKISEKHANFIVNLGDAKSDDVIKLIQFIKIKIKDKFSVELEEEIQYL
ncbi:UDP-N-acetylmuramate dehydrogenase [Patescibacteria group bacterium]